MSNRVGWQRWLPGLQALRTYRGAWLTHDIAAGLVLAAVGFVLLTVFKAPAWAVVLVGAAGGVVLALV